MFSIDQNCSSLWDVIPKLSALAAAGHKPCQFVEDVDVAFTAMGAKADQPMRIARERFYRSGGQDWGAAAFYSGFLGRLPVEIRDFEPFTAQKTAALARQLEKSVDELYDEFSPADNWQLTGSSYAGDRRHHRVIGDLGLAETVEHLRELMKLAQREMLERFPQPQPQERLTDWFASQNRFVEDFARSNPVLRLVDLYRAWLELHLGGSTDIRFASELFSIRRRTSQIALLELFTRRYEQACELYNQAVEEAGVGVQRLDVDAGELPFFAILSRAGRQVRTQAFLKDPAIQLGDETFPLKADGRLPLEQLSGAGVIALAGKAVLLVMQATAGPDGKSLALPYRGSSYMPAAHLFYSKLSTAGLLDTPLNPITRVRMRLLDRLAGCQTLIHLPTHLASYFGRDEISADSLSADWRRIMQEAADRLESFRDRQGRAGWQKQTFTQESEELNSLDARRRQLAKVDPKGGEIQELSRRAKQIERELAWQTLRQIDRDWQASQLDYWDSRGAPLPWALALGGQDFYNDLIARAEISQEPWGSVIQNEQD
ncbi:MAG: hypothetical protein HZA50_02010 [Planctomycetes bacterium]|nr:hypothetical protein [Planctomycetota bacterium]